MGGRDTEGVALPKRAPLTTPPPPSPALSPNIAEVSENLTVPTYCSEMLQHTAVASQASYVLAVSTAIALQQQQQHLKS